MDEEGMVGVTGVCCCCDLGRIDHIHTLSSRPRNSNSLPQHKSTHQPTRPPKHPCITYKSTNHQTTTYQSINQSIPTNLQITKPPPPTTPPPPPPTTTTTTTITDLRQVPHLLRHVNLHPIPDRGPGGQHDAHHRQRGGTRHQRPHAWEVGVGDFLLLVGFLRVVVGGGGGRG
jgi:hypothetical protein